MGQVFKARDTRLGRAVAIKVTHDQFSSRFQSEARAISSLNHPNICTLYDVGPDYLVMELLEGETLRELLKRAPLPWRKAAELGAAIAEGLAAAHSKGIVHQDIKPANIFLTSDGRVKILDFGLARPEDAAFGERCSGGRVKQPR